MTSKVAVAFTRPPFEAGAKPSFSMATLMSNEPVAVSNPLSATSITSSEPSLFKPQPKTDSLSSIASAGLHVSRSSDQLPPMTSPTSVPADRPEHEKDVERNSSQVAREALGASEKSPGATIHEPSVHASPEQMQIDSNVNGSPSDPYGSNDHHGSLMHASTVASPGPIEESTSQDGDRRPRDDSEIDHDGKAFSYPMPTMNDPRRGLSLPNAGYNRNSPRSPSTKKHRCPYCATEFTRQHNLKSHLLTHSQEKPFVCQTCQSRFRRLHDLKRHTKLHTGERPHICPKCGRRFARGDALARHNKGQGNGCAGRRSSMGSFAADDEYGDGATGGPDDMDGLMYTAEPERMDEEDERRLMPSIRKHDSDAVARSDSLNSRQSNTYPPIAAGRPSHLYPPPANHGGNPSTSQPGNMTFPPAGLTSGSSVFPSNNLSDSPKALSPNALSSQHDNAPPHRAHSPGVGQSLPHPQSSFGRTNQSSNHPPPTLGLPLPQPGAPQLPLPPGMTSPDARFGMQAATKHTPSHSHSSTHSLSTFKGPEGSDANSSDASQIEKLWAHVRTMHEEMTGLRTEVAALRAHIASTNSSAPPAPVEVNLNNAVSR